MKKILSLILSLSLMATVMLGTTAFAADGIDSIVDTDISTAEAASFKAYVESNEGDFNENYFFMSTFIMPSSSQTTWDQTTSDEVKLVLTTEKNDTNIECYVGWYPYMNGYGCIAADGQTVALTTNGSPLTIDKDICMYNLFLGSVDDETTKTKTTYGVALKDATQLKEDTEITLKLVSVIDGVETIIDSASYTFEAPISFEEEELADLAAVLKDLDNGKEVEAETIKNALSKITSDKAKAELIAATKDTVGDNDETIPAKISKDAIDALVKVLKDDVVVNISNNSTSGAGVLLPNAALILGDAVDVVVTDADVIEDVEVPDDKAKFAIDISLEKDGSKIQPLFPQIVEIELPLYFAKGENKKVTVYHKISDTEIKEDEVKIVGGKASFVADSFSTFMVVGDEIVISENDLADEVQVVIERRKDANGEDTNIFDIGIAPSGINASSSAIVNFVDATFGLRITGLDTADVNAMVSCDYTLTGADGIVIDGINNHESVGANALVDINFLAQVPGGKEGTASITKGLGETLPIAVLELNGIGAAHLEVGGIDIGNTSSSNNVIYTEVNQNRAKATPLYQSAASFTIEQKKHNIAIKIEFANALADTNLNNTEYLGMTVVFKNLLTGDTQTAIVGNGADTDVNYLKILNHTDTDGLMVTTAEGSVELIADNTYTFEVKGAGFRTVRGSVLADKDKKITLWNNARTSNPEEIVSEDGNPVYKNFLVGDIYMDGIVDIYDLSAVTSYYAPKKAVTGHKYATYDLNRDGYIDAADIAYVQVSYGN